MSLEQLVEHYGYLAILIGTALEGETVLVLGGIAAKLGYLDLPWVILAAFIGTAMGDQFFFFLGRYHGSKFLAKHPKWLQRTEKVDKLLKRHRIPIILGYRFLYGLRSVTPFVIGMSRLPAVEFVLLNIIAVALWAALIASLGYAFGRALELVIDDIKKYQLQILLVMSLVAGVIWLIYRIRKKLLQSGN